MLLEQFRVGDLVCRKPIEGKRPPVNTTQLGRIIRKNRVVTFQPRIGSGAKTAGVYEEDNGGLVLWENGQFEMLSTNLKLALPSVEQSRANEFEKDVDSLSYSELIHRLRNRVRIADLPFTKFWESDLVEFRERHCKRRALVRSISYTDDPEESQDPYYHIQVLDDRNTPLYHLAHRESELTLLQRGPIFRYLEHSIEPPTLAQKKVLAKQLDRYQLMRNPNTENFAWDMNSGIIALLAGEIDDIEEVDTGRITVSYNAYRYDDPALGAQVRADFLSRKDNRLMLRDEL